jgi:hypothetical protein
MATHDSRPKLPRPEQNRLNRTTHGWSQHPNYEICRALWRRAENHYLNIDTESWPDLIAFVAGVTGEIGVRRDRLHIIKPIEGDELRPGNIYWHVLDRPRFNRRQLARSEAEHPWEWCACPTAGRWDCPCPRAAMWRIGYDADFGEDDGTATGDPWEG